MSLIQELASSSDLLLVVIAVLGLLIGSFLNVVILRVPAMMESTWRREAQQILKLTPADTSPAPGVNLWSPPSCCPQCHARIRPWHNIPVLSWLWLCGRCADCKTPISVQYPLVELACGILSAVCAWRFGWSLQLAGALVLSWTLLALAVIDLRTQLLPDTLTLPLLWLGLLLSLGGIYCSPTASIIGAAAGYLLLWSVYHLFRLVTGKEGMGYGDFKLLAALGAWLGGTMLPMILLLASGVGAVVGISLVLFRRHDRNVPISFGPYLAGAGWIALIWGDRLLHLGAHLGGGG